MAIMTSSQNPILTDFRRMIEGIIDDGSTDTPTEAERWLWLMDMSNGNGALFRWYGFDYLNLTRKHVTHAKRVLRKTANLKERH